MSPPILQATETWRRAFHYGNPLMLLLWRLGLGPVLNALPTYAGQLMVLVHIGRKTGKTRRQPLNYSIVNGDVFCIAGFGASSDWYRNIAANPRVQVWLPDGWWEGIAKDVSAAPERSGRLDRPPCWIPIAATRQRAPPRRRPVA